MHGAGEQARAAEVARSLQAAELIDEISGAKSARETQRQIAVSEAGEAKASRLQEQRDVASEKRQAAREKAADERLDKRIKAQDERLGKQIKATEERQAERLKAAEEKANEAEKARIRRENDRASVTGYRESVKMYDKLFSDATSYDEPGDAITKSLYQRYQQLQEQYKQLKERGLDVQEPPAVTIPITLDPAGLLNKETYHIPAEVYGDVEKFRNKGYSDGDIVKWLKTKGHID